MKTEPNRTWNTASWIWIALISVMAFATAPHYGDSWDENVRANAGERKFEYYQYLFAGKLDEAIATVPENDNYPGLHDLSLAALRRLSPLSGHLTGNFFSALIGLVGIVGTIRLGRLWGGPRTGFFAGVLITLLPAYYGHMFINPKDLPFAAGYIWATGLIFQWTVSTRPPPWNRVTLCGLAIGLTMATRIGGLVLLCYLCLFAVLSALARPVANKGTGIFEHLKPLSLFLLPRLLLAGAIAFAVLLLFWPSGQMRPFGGASQTLANVTHFDWTMQVFFEGRYQEAEGLPWYYILKMILIKVPVPTLLLFAAGCCLVIHKILKSGITDEESIRTHLGTVFILFSICFPVAYVIARDSVLYNGLRHLLFILPPLCVVAAHALSAALSAAKNLSPPLRRLTPWMAAIIVGFPAISLIRLHPYQYIYYNALAGGTSGAGRSYELDYWGTAYKELAEGFVGHLRETRPTFTRPCVVVNMEHVTWLFEPFLPDTGSLPIEVVRSRPELADYYAASTIWAADQYYGGIPVVEVKRAGHRLAVMKKLPPSAPGPSE